MTPSEATPSLCLSNTSVQTPAALHALEEDFF